MSGDQTDRLREFMEQGIPFNAFMGMTVTRMGDGEAEMAIPARPELTGDPFRPALHGGVVSALADTVGGLAVFTRAGRSRSASTVDLRVDYRRGQGPVRARPGLAARQPCRRHAHGGLSRLHRRTDRHCECCVQHGHNRPHAAVAKRRVIHWATQVRLVRVQCKVTVCRGAMSMVPAGAAAAPGKVAWMV